MTPQDAQKAAAEAFDKARLGNWPAITEALLRALRKEFPDQAPARGADYGDVMFGAGQASVTRFLAYLLVYQENPEAEPDAIQETFHQYMLGDLDKY